MKLARPGWNKSNLVNRVLLDVISPPPQFINAQMTKDTAKVNFCCCFGRGTIDLSAMTDKNAYTGGEQCTITYEVANNSTEKITHIYYTLKQITIFSAQGHRKAYTSVIVKADLGAVEKGDASGQKTAVIQLPHIEHSSVASQTLSISYVIQLTAVTASCCVTDPSVELPVQIFKPPPMVGAIAVAVALEEGEIPMAQAIPWNPDGAMGGSPMEIAAADRTPKPVPMDTTGDGFADAMGYDMNGDGVVDMLDTTMDGVPDTYVGGGGGGKGGGGGTSVAPTPQTTTMQVQIPQGVSDGMQFQIQIGDQIMAVACPPGAGPGTTIEIQVPAAGAAPTAPSAPLKQ